MIVAIINFVVIQKDKKFEGFMVEILFGIVFVMVVTILLYSGWKVIRMQS